MCTVLVPCPQPPPLTAPATDRPRYVVTVRVPRSFRTVSGRVDVTFTPNRPTNRLVFRLWPNGPSQLRSGSRLDAGPVGNLKLTRPDPTTLVVHLGRTLDAGSNVHVSLPWRLQMPRTHQDRIARFGNGIRLGTFLPLLAWDDRRGWLLDPPARILAETAATPAADFDLRVAAPQGFRVVATGVPYGGNRFKARAVRDVALAIGHFRVQSARADAVTVRVASTGLPKQQARTLLTDATHALQTLSARYGAYPWRSYTLVVPPDLPTVGIEYPMLSFIGHSRFDPLIVNHETAHQWFYSLVGNDQARDPWLDETLATWGQVRLGSSEFPPAQAVPDFAGTHVGSPMTYWDQHPRWYFYGVYAAGLKALQSLGDDDAVDCALRRYVARRAYSIAQPGDLLDELNRVIPAAERRLRVWGIHP
jgi:hypothetical protein